jgi:hypothetical protein
MSILATSDNVSFAIAVTRDLARGRRVASGLSSSLGRWLLRRRSLDRCSPDRDRYPLAVIGPTR